MTSSDAIEISAPAGARILLVTLPNNHGMEPKHIEDMRRKLEHDLWMAAEKDQWPQVLIAEEGITVHWLENETPAVLGPEAPR